MSETMEMTDDAIIASIDPEGFRRYLDAMYGDHDCVCHSDWSEDMPLNGGVIRKIRRFIAPNGFVIA